MFTNPVGSLLVNNLSIEELPLTFATVTKNPVVERNNAMFTSNFSNKVPKQNHNPYSLNNFIKNQNLLLPQDQITEPTKDDKDTSTNKLKSRSKRK